MAEHHHSFHKNIISSYELHSFFRYFILKFEKLRQAAAKYIEAFYKIFSLPPLRKMLMSLQITPRPCCRQITDKLLTHYEKFSLDVFLIALTLMVVYFISILLIFEIYHTRIIKLCLASKGECFDICLFEY